MELEEYVCQLNITMTHLSNADLRQVWSYRELCVLDHDNIDPIFNGNIPENEFSSIVVAAALRAHYSKGGTRKHKGTVEKKLLLRGGGEHWKWGEKSIRVGKNSPPFVFMEWLSESERWFYSDLPVLSRLRCWFDSHTWLRCLIFMSCSACYGLSMSPFSLFQMYAALLNITNPLNVSVTIFWHHLASNAKYRDMCKEMN